MTENYSATAETVGQYFDEMAEEYDHLKDLWYSYSFARIDSLIQRFFRVDAAESGAARKTVVDVGCGTGIQSLTFAGLGYRVVGVDLAEALLKKAKDKLDSNFPGRAEFIRGDAERLPLTDGVADVVNCCGPTINFVPDYQRALGEIARVLKPGGRLILESEQKWNLDILWEVVSALLGNILEYDESLRDALRHFLPPFGTGHMVKYAFRAEAGKKVYMLLKLFTPEELRIALEAAGMRVDREFGIHIVTNVFPSTVLHAESPAPWLRCAFRGLAGIESCLYNKRPFSRLGCSLVVTATKI